MKKITDGKISAFICTNEDTLNFSEPKQEPIEEVTIQTTWLRRLLEIAEKVREQLDKLPPEDFHVIIKTDISALIGFASSAKNILEIKEDLCQKN